MEKIERLIKTKVLCMFEGGSYAYGLESDNSDHDIMVIIDDDISLVYLPFFESTTGKEEYFIMGKNYFQKIHNFDEDTNSFIASFADNILGVHNNGNLIYLDENYKQEFEELALRKWENRLPLFLHRFVSYFRLIMTKDINLKRYYHIYRLRAMLDNLDLTGSFNLNYVEPYKSKMLEYKKNYLKQTAKIDEFHKLLDYIENYARKMEEETNG